MIHICVFDARPCGGPCYVEVCDVQEYIIVQYILYFSNAGNEQKTNKTQQNAESLPQLADGKPFAVGLLTA